jgi:adenine-specific DNA-methyltransferase
VARGGGEVSLVWPNKDLVLTAVGERDYGWGPPKPDAAPLRATELAVVGGGESNVVACGDALDVIAALSGDGSLVPASIRMLYVDPPFNTGRTFGDYHDGLDRAVWLSMFRDRLLAVQPFLAPDSSVWVHLDDSESHRARCILDEVFGAEAFVTTVIWQKRTTRESRSAFSTNHDNILVYAPAGPKTWKRRRNLLVNTAKELRNRDADPRGPWADAPFTAPGFRANQQYPITNPAGETLLPPRGRSWYATEPTYLQLLTEDRIWFPRDGAGSPRLKLFPHQIRGLVPFSVWGSAETGTNDDAKRHLQMLFPNDENVFATPKPEELLERIIHISTDPGELVIDLFAGSATTATAAHKMGRKWIAIERSPATVANVLLPRLGMVVAGEDSGGITEAQCWSGGGSFRVVQVEPSSGRVTTVQVPALPVPAVPKASGQRRAS